MIHEVSKTLCAQLIDQLYPDYLLDRDGVQLCIPRHEHQDVQIGIYLYDISEYSITAQRYASVDGDSRVFPPKLMELSYLIYVNEDARFGGYNKEQEEILYEKMIQIFHDLSVLQVKDSKLCSPYSFLFSSYPADRVFPPPAHSAQCPLTMELKRLRPQSVR